VEYASAARWRFWPEAVLALILAAGLFVTLQAVMPHDVAWQLWIGRQLIHGTPLYSEIQEINPPLWFWISALLAGAAERLRVADALVLATFFATVTSLSACLLAVLIRDQAMQTRAVLYGAFALAAIGLPLSEFGQREHFTLIACIPYVALIAGRAEGRPISFGLALSAAILAAVGFALKPYFAFAPLLLEAWLYLTARPLWRMWRTEVVVLAIGAAAYGVAVVLFTPEFLTVMLPAVSLAYGGYSVTPRMLLRSDVVSLSVLGACAVGVLGGPRSRLSAAFLVAAAAFLVAYLIQFKGWPYQGVPALGLLTLGVAAEAAHRASCGTLSFRDRAGVSFIGLVVGLTLITTANAGFYRNAYRPFTEAALQDLPPGATVMMLSAHASSLWPMVEERGLIWPSRHFTFWMLPAIARGAASQDPALAALADRVRAETVEDLRCNPPQRILVDDARLSGAFRGVPFDYLEFFQADPNFAELFADYRMGPVYGRIAVYDRVGQTRAESRSFACRQIY
jgi:hypothetical protein